MQIFVVISNPRGDRLATTLEVQATDTVGQLKQKICDKTCVSPNDQRLIFRTRQLQDDRTVADYGIAMEDTLELVLYLRSGPGGGIETLEGFEGGILVEPCREVEGVCPAHSLLDSWPVDRPVVVTFRVQKLSAGDQDRMLFLYVTPPSRPTLTIIKVDEVSEAVPPSWHDFFNDVVQRPPGEVVLQESTAFLSPTTFSSAPDIDVVARFMPEGGFEVDTAYSVRLEIGKRVGFDVRFRTCSEK